MEMIPPIFIIIAAVILTVAVAVFISSNHTPDAVPAVTPTSNPATQDTINPIVNPTVNPSSPNTTNYNPPPNYCAWGCTPTPSGGGGSTGGTSGTSGTSTSGSTNGGQGNIPSTPIVRFSDSGRQDSPAFNVINTFQFSTSNISLDSMAKEIYTKQFLNSFHPYQSTTSDGISIGLNSENSGKLVYMGEMDWMGKTLEVETNTTIIGYAQDMCRDIMLNKTHIDGYVQNTENPFVIALNPDSQLQPIAFCYDVYLKSGNKTMLQEVEPTMVRILERMNDSVNGTITNTDNTETDVYNTTKFINTSLISHFGGQWWDSWKIPQGSFSAYDNIYWYLANYRMYQMESILNNTNATIYYNQSQKIKNDFDAMFWNQTHYVTWVVNGTVKDYQTTWTNWEAIFDNVTNNQSQVNTIVSFFDNQTTASGKGVYPSKYGIMDNLLDPCADGYITDCSISGATKRSNFGGYENADHFFQMTGKDVWVRSATNNKTFAWQLYKNYIDFYQHGDLYCCGKETYTWNGTLTGGTVFLSDASVTHYGFYDGILGIHPYLDRIDINATDLPNDLFGTTLNYTWLGKTFTITFNQNGTISIPPNTTLTSFNVGRIDQQNTVTMRITELKS